MEDENKVMNRREVLRVGLAAGASGVLGFAAAACTSGAPPATAQASPGAAATPDAPGGTTTTASCPPAAPAPTEDPKAKAEHDITLLNAAIGLEHLGIFAYSAAAKTGKLDASDALATAVRTLALRNKRDHEGHRDALIAMVKRLGGTPLAAKAEYDVSGYLSAKEGHLDDVAGIARLALAIECDAALAYIDAFSALKNLDVLKAAATIGPVESAHAAALRALLQPVLAQSAAKFDHIVPAGFLNKDTRKTWVIVV